MLNFALIAIVVILIILCFDKARFWLKRTFRFFFYDNFLVKLVRHKVLEVFLPGASTAYYLCLDIWGDKWEFIKNHQSTHELVFSLLLGGSLVVLMFRGAADFFEEKSDRSFIKFLESFSRLTSIIVNKKLERFKDQAVKLKPNGNTFKTITQPKDQINLILVQIEELLFDNFNIKKNQLSITIMHQNTKEDIWHYQYETNINWRHTKAQRLIEEKSTAAECLNIGEPIFHADKETAEKDGKYLMSDRDKRTGVGSVFCYPAFTKNKDYRDNYIISIVTYGKRLCDPWDKEQAQAILEIFVEICRHLDLELTLNSIKEWQYEYHSNSSRR